MIKFKITFFLLIVTVCCFSQTTPNFNFYTTTNPSPNSDLSIYFKKNVSRKLLREVKFFPKKNNIVLWFSINKEMKPYNISLNIFGGKKAGDAIKSAFKKYPLEKLGIETLRKKNRYSIQIISKKGTKNTFNCSTKTIIETSISTISCADLDTYIDIEKCVSQEVKKHIYNVSNFDVLKTLNEDETNLNISLSVSEKGELINEKSKIPAVFKTELEKAIATFPMKVSQRTLNNEVKQSLIDFTIKVKKNEQPKFEKKSVAFNSFTKPSPNNELSIFLKEQLSQSFIDKANLNRIHDQLTISFEINKKGKSFNHHTNSRSDALNKKIISIFKNYPLTKLNFSGRKAFSTYTFQVLSLNENNETIINASSLAESLSIPIFRGCEQSKNVKEAKKCFSKGIQQHFAQNFDAKLPNRLGLPSGKIRIYIGFKINKKGNVENIKTKLSRKSKEIKNEVLKVMKTIPSSITGAYHNGKPVNIKYSIPFTLIID